MKKLLLMVTFGGALVACGERPQTLGAGKQDVAPYSGVSKAFADGSWNQRDKASWESHLTARGQYGQNDYTRMK